MITLERNCATLKHSHGWKLARRIAEAIQKDQIFCKGCDAHIKHCGLFAVISSVQVIEHVNKALGDVTFYFFCENCAYEYEDAYTRIMQRTIGPPKKKKD